MQRVDREQLINVTQSFPLWRSHIFVISIFTFAQRVLQLHVAGAVRIPELRSRCCQDSEAKEQALSASQSLSRSSALE